ncbi:DivIVA domain-containing protein [Nocardiopsis ansamitocini]|nr:DivIVA domain-containing protein [Nocardiopsis ansamitocini]
MVSIEQDDVQSPQFDVVLRGYDRNQVTTAVAAVLDSRSNEPAESSEWAHYLHGRIEFDVVLRGFDRGQVEAWFAANTGAHATEEEPAAPRPKREPPGFDVVLRGYDRNQVDEFVQRAQDTVDAASDVPPLGRAEAADTTFDVVLRGYDRSQVTTWIGQISEQLPD